MYLDYHIKSHAAPAAAATERRPRPPSLQPPKLAAQCSEARFAEFERAWGFYKQSVDMPAGATTSYLLSCCDEDLRGDVQAATQDILTKPEDEVMTAIKRYAVQQRAQCSIKMELMAMVQDHGEGVRKFYARVQNVARQCKLTVPCQNNTCRLRLAPFTSYNDEIVKLVVLNGIADTEIRKDVLGVAGINDKTLDETVGIIEDKEMAARSVAGRAATPAAASTSYKKIASSDRRLKETGKCEKCGRTFNNKKPVSYTHLTLPTKA